MATRSARSALGFDPQKLMAGLIQSGKVHIRVSEPSSEKIPKPPRPAQGEYEERERARRRAEQAVERAHFIALGLTSNGTKRKNLHHPCLKGLIGREYHRAYNRLYNHGKGFVGMTP